MNSIAGHQNTAKKYNSISEVPENNTTTSIHKEIGIIKDNRK